MQFTHRTYIPGDTIVALATPPGEGGVAIVRISGNDAQEVAKKMLSSKNFTSHIAHVARVITESGITIDRALILPLLGKKSFTGEDTIEIHCHGGTLIPSQVIKRAIECGARAANPGEFSFRAFSNGKLSLSQAEAIQQLIASKNETALKSAMQQLEGRLHKQITHIQKSLFDIAAILEAWVDFPEEGLEFASIDDVLQELTSMTDQLAHLLATYQDGKRLSSSYSLCLLGEPNVGKSSLLNALAGRDRAIVTDIAGTTRDLLEEELHFSGYSFRVIDTAGIRETDEIVEKEGVRRSKKAASEADIVVLVLDRTKGLSGAKELLESLPKEKTIIVWNKADLEHRKDIALPFEHIVHLSAKQESGIIDLQNALLSFTSHGNKEEFLITVDRHYHALLAAKEHLSKVIEGLKTDISAEFVSSDMRACLKELGTIIGSDVTEDLLSSIFSKFCVGK